jgi:hypothetical protein
MISGKSLKKKLVLGHHARYSFIFTLNTLINFFLSKFSSSLLELRFHKSLGSPLLYSAVSIEFSCFSNSLSSSWRKRRLRAERTLNLRKMKKSLSLPMKFASAG